MKKMEILNRLVKDGAIDLEEALILMATEEKIIERVVIKEVVVDNTKPVWPLQPYISPFNVPVDPNNPKWMYHPTCAAYYKQNN